MAGLAVTAGFTIGSDIFYFRDVVFRNAGSNLTFRNLKAFTDYFIFFNAYRLFHELSLQSQLIQVLLRIILILGGAANLYSGNL